MIESPWFILGSIVGAAIMWMMGHIVLNFFMRSADD